MRIDKYYDKLIVWDKVFADPDSAQYEHLSFEAIRAVSISQRFFVFLIFLQIFER